MVGCHLKVKLGWWACPTLVLVLRILIITEKMQVSGGSWNCSWNWQLRIHTGFSAKTVMFGSKVKGMEDSWVIQWARLVGEQTWKNENDWVWCKTWSSCWILVGIYWWLLVPNPSSEFWWDWWCTSEWCIWNLAIRCSAVFLTFYNGIPLLDKRTRCSRLKCYLIPTTFLFF